MPSTSDGAAQRSLMPVRSVPRLSPVLWPLLWVALAGAGIAIEHGFETALAPPLAIHTLQLAFAAAYWLQRLTMPPADPDASRPTNWLDYVLLAMLAIGAIASLLGLSAAWHAVELSLGLTLLLQLWHLHAVLSRRLPRPGLLFPASFALLIVLGTASPA